MKPMLRYLLTLLLLSGALLPAQTAPNAIGAPETELAGIDLQHTTIAAIQQTYGMQDSVFAVPPDPYPRGTKLYKWGRLTVTLKVLTEPAAGGEAIRAVEVRGEGEPGDKPINKTGRGLKLGAKSTAIKKIYGVDAVNGSATLVWPDGTTLIIGVNEKKSVNKLELRAPASPH